jgi:hypothetical protein
MSPSPVIARQLSRWLRPGFLLGLILFPAMLPAQTERRIDFETVASFGLIGVGQGEPADTLASVEVRLAQNWHGIRPWLGTSVVGNGTWFAGAGFVRDFTPSPDWVVTLGTGPFYYKSDKRDLGLDLEFYSFIEATRRLRHDMRAGLRVGHLSNGGLGRRNPGTEDVTLVLVLSLTRARASALRHSNFPSPVRNEVLPAMSD